MSQLDSIFCNNLEHINFSPTKQYNSQANFQTRLPFWIFESHMQNYPIKFIAHCYCPKRKFRNILCLKIYRGCFHFSTCPEALSRKRSTNLFFAEQLHTKRLFACAKHCPIRFVNARKQVVTTFSVSQLSLLSLSLSVLPVLQRADNGAFYLSSYCYYACI